MELHRRRQLRPRPPRRVQRHQHHPRRLDGRQRRMALPGPAVQLTAACPTPTRSPAARPPTTATSSATAPNEGYNLSPTHGPSAPWRYRPPTPTRLPDRGAHRPGHNGRGQTPRRGDHLGRASGGQQHHRLRALPQMAGTPGRSETVPALGPESHRGPHQLPGQVNRRLRHDRQQKPVQSTRCTR